MRRTTGVVAAATAMLLLPAATGTSLLYEQDFSEDADGWLDADDGWHGSIVHDPATETARVFGDASGAPFSRFDGYRDEWPGDHVAELDVHLDPSAWSDGEGFDYSVAATGTDGNHQRDFIFHVTRDTSSGALLVGGSNNTTFAPREDLDTLANHLEITEAGWYTLQHVFRDAGGVLAVDLNVLDADGQVLFTETRTDAQDTIPDEVGGNRYAWFTVVDVADGLRIDDHELALIVAVPGDKDDCKDGGFEEYGFENQGQCIASLQAGEPAGR